MAEDAREQEASQALFVSILSDGGPGPSSRHTSSAAGAEQAFKSRVLGKRITLANVDRQRPAPEQGSLAQRQIKRRDTRLWKGRKQGMPSSTPHSNREKKRARAAKDDGSTKPLSRRQRKARGLEDVDENLNYDILLPVHSLWTGYVQALLGLVDVDGQPSYASSIQHSKTNVGEATVHVISSAQSTMQNAIVKADFVGAPIRVIRAKNPSLVGIEGLVARETESTFLVVQRALSASHSEGARRSKVVKTVPKANAVFSVQVALPGVDAVDPATTSIDFSTEQAPLIATPTALQFTLYGRQLCNSLPTRATKKFKARKTIDLG